MSKDASIARLKRQIAELEAKLADLRHKLAALESGLTLAKAAAEDVVLALWKAALPKSRERSSKHRCRVAWNRLPKSERPDRDAALAALSAWNRSEGWTMDRNQFAPGLHRFIAERMWEDVPEVADPISKYRAPKPAAPAPDPGEVASPDEIRAILGGLKGPCTPPASPVQPSGTAGQISHFPAETGTDRLISTGNPGTPGDPSTP